MVDPEDEDFAELLSKRKTIPGSASILKMNRRRWDERMSTAEAGKRRDKSISDQARSNRQANREP
jgi:RNase H-fold protein (predicted Holliday junction resolvase)